jgi:outer membrane receptor protein involved in Fe transport
MVAVPVFGQDADVDDDQIETITVTAQFREQKLTDVPLAITAYDGAFLDQIGVAEFDELSAFTPGFVVQEQSVNNPGFVLRGITSDSGASNIEPRVSVFQNGVSIARSRASIVQLFDIERVEVLKGPQGTLFGRSAQIGAVHVITNKPKFEFEGGGEIEFGNFDGRRFNGYINLPLSETVAVRAAAAYENRDGYVDNTEGGDLNGTETFASRLSLRFKPSDDLIFDLISHYSKDTPPGTSFKSGVIPALNGTTNPNRAASLNTFGNFLNGEELGVDREIFDITAIVDWQINDNWRMVTTGAYREFDSLEVFDPDGTAIDIFIFAEDAEGEQYSLDTRFSYDDGGALRGFFGGGIFFEEGSQGVPLGLNIGNTAAVFGSLARVGPADENGVAPFAGALPLAQALLSGDPAVVAAVTAAAGIPQDVFQLEDFTNFSDNSSFDIFAEIEYDFTEDLTLTLGGRYTIDNKETLFSSAIVQANPLTPLIVGTQGLFVGNSGGVISSDDAGVDDSFDGFSWRAVLRYQLTENANVYFNYSRGRRPQVIEDNGVAQPDGSATVDFNVIPAETVDSYELGAKGSFLDNKLNIDAAFYYYDYTNFQTTVAVDAGPGLPPQFVNVNGGTADSLGIEVGLDARFTENLNLFATYAYNRGRFNDTDDEGNPQQFGGNQFRLSPDHSFSVGLGFEHPTDYGTWFITPTYTWKSSVFFEDENTGPVRVVDPATGTTIFNVPGVSQGSFGLANIRAGLMLWEDKVRVQFYVENLFDKEYIIDGGNTGGALGIPTFIAGAPRFYGGSVSVKF